MLNTNTECTILSDAYTIYYMHIIYLPIYAILFMCLFIYPFICFIFILDQAVTSPDNPSLHPSSISYTLQGDDGGIRGGTRRGVEVVKGVGERQPSGEAGEVRSGATRQNPQKVVVVGLSSICTS